MEKILVETSARHVHQCQEDLEALFGKGATLTMTDGQVSENSASSGGGLLVQSGAVLNLKGGNYVVDLAGKNVTITGSGNVTCFDSSNADY